MVISFLSEFFHVYWYQAWSVSPSWPLPNVQALSYWFHICLHIWTLTCIKFLQSREVCFVDYFNSSATDWVVGLIPKNLHKSNTFSWLVRLEVDICYNPNQVKLLPPNLDENLQILNSLSFGQLILHNKFAPMLSILQYSNFQHKIHIFNFYRFSHWVLITTIISTSTSLIMQ